jgi:hypothetical protein
LRDTSWYPDWCRSDYGSPDNASPDYGSPDNASPDYFFSPDHGTHYDRGHFGTHYSSPDACRPDTTAHRKPVGRPARIWLQMRRRRRINLHDEP